MTFALFRAEVISHSVCPRGTELTTMLFRYPRQIHAEVMTHRKKSKNSASSRAIPVRRMLEQVLLDPYVPEVVGVNQPGMAASAYHSGEDLAEHTESVLQDRDQAVYGALQKLLGINLTRDLFGSRGDVDRDLTFRTPEGVERIGTALDALEAHVRQHGRDQSLYLNTHKQTANRYLEPFAWHDIIISSTSWSNWDGLRISEHAQPEIKRLAELAREARAASSPEHLYPGQWHAPLLDEAELALLRRCEDDEDLDAVRYWTYVSAGRCAAVSYNNHARKDAPRDSERTEGMVKNGHFSPLEHPATPAADPGTYGNFDDWFQLRKTVPHEHDFTLAVAAQSAAA